MRAVLRSRKGRRARRGVSLMEVLISVFVVSVGLLGLAAMFPIGRFALVEAGKADRSGNGARAVLREIKVRGLLECYRNPLNPGSQPVHDDDIHWDYRPGQEPTWWQAVMYPYEVPQSQNYIRAFAIDPLGALEGMGNLGPLPRITYRWITTAGAPRERAWEVFTWHDDLSIEMPTNEDLRPQLVIPQLRLEPEELQNISYRPEVPDSKGEFSWLATVVPAPGEVYLPFAQKSRFHVSVAAVYRRVFGAGGQFVANTQFIDAGLGGGTVRLTDPQPNNDATPFKIKQDEWILLCAQRVSEPAYVPIDVCHWYRVVSAAPDDQGWRVTLNGPDWPVNPAKDSTRFATAVVIPGVVGVYNTTIELDRSAVWNK